MLTKEPQPSHTSPDAHGAGFLKEKLNPLRYNGQSNNPDESSGILYSLMPENVRVLDVGCGTGSLTLIANDGKHNEVVAIEPDFARAELARIRGIDTVCGFLDAEFFAQRGLFDVIMFGDVLEHLAAPDEMLRLAHQGLKPGGIVLTSVPNVAHWSVRLKLLFGNFDYTETGICDATHLHWFTEKTIRELFESQGFQVTDLRYSAGHFLAVYKSKILRLAPSRVRRVAVRNLTRLLPKLFGCQFVIKARKV